MFELNANSLILLASKSKWGNDDTQGKRFYLNVGDKCLKY